MIIKVYHSCFFDAMEIDGVDLTSMSMDQYSKIYDKVSKRIKVKVAKLGGEMHYSPAANIFYLLDSLEPDSIEIGSELCDMCGEYSSSKVYKI